MDNNNNNTEKLQKLIFKLNEIDNQLEELVKILDKLWNSAYQSQNTNLQASIVEKSSHIKTLQIKIKRARLNLNYHFMS